jgi:hypothetical protein
MGLNLPVAGEPNTANFLVTSISPYPENNYAPNANVPASQPFPIVSGLILNHQYMTRPAPRT